MATTAGADPYRIQVTQAGSDDPISFLDPRDWPIAGESFDVRVTVFDQYNQVVEDFDQLDRDVTLVLKGMHGQWNDNPFASNSTVFEVSADDFEDGVAEDVTVDPIFAGFQNMRFWATDGNIVTDNASRVVILDEQTGLVEDELAGFFTIQPADIEVTYSGGNRSLSEGTITEEVDVLVRIRMLNDDGSTAIGYNGPIFQISGAELAHPPYNEVSTSFGGIVDMVRLIPTDTGSDQTIILSDVHGMELSYEASDEFDIVAPQEENRADVSVDNLLQEGQHYPGATQRVRYRLNNDADDPIGPPIDTLFRLIDPSDNDRVLLQWVEQDDEGIDDGEDSGNLNTFFVLPEHLTAGSYTLQIRPGYVDANEQTLEYTVEVLPDLAIRHFDYAPGEYRGGDAIRFNLTFYNLWTDDDDGLPTSAVPDDQSYRLQIHLSPTPSFGDDDDFLVWQGSFGGEGSNDLLHRGEQVDVDDYFMLPENFEGSYYLLARINSAGGVDGEGFEQETLRGTTTTWGNNTTFGRESDKITIHPRQSTDTFRVSLTSTGGQSPERSDNPVVSRDGRYVAFESFGNLTGEGTTSTRDVYVRNVIGEQITLVSAPTSGAPNGHSGNPSITDNGRFIAFQSTASNLVTGDTNGYSDIFVRDIHEGTTRRLTVNPETGEEANHGSQLARISPDGRFVVFESTATNLLPDADPAADTLSSGTPQVYLYDRDVAGTGTFDTVGNTSIQLISQGDDDSAGWRIDPASGQHLVAGATNPNISADGNHIAFVTRATNIVGSSTAFPQIVVWNRESGEFTVVSVDPDTGNFADNISGYPSISGKGEYVAFSSRAQNMTDDVYNNTIPHLFRARIEDGSVSEVLRVNSGRGDGDMEPSQPIGSNPELGSLEPTLSDDGQILAFASEARNLLPEIPVRNLDRTMFHSADVFNYRDDNNASDIYLVDFENPDAPRIRRASVSRFGYRATDMTVGAGTRTQHPPASRRPAVSPDGRFVAFTSDGQNHYALEFGDTNYDYVVTNGVRDVFLFDLKRGLQPPDDLPQVRLLLPDTVKAVAGSTIPLTAKATADIGSLEAVEFYANNTLVGTVPAAAIDSWNQLTFDWNIPVLAGNPNPQQYDIIAMAIDSNGIRSEVSNVSQLIAAPQASEPPAVEMINPDGEGLTVTDQSIWPFVAQAAVEGRDIDTVEFFIQHANEDGRGISMGFADPEPDHDAFRLNFDFSDLPDHFVPFETLPPGNYAVMAVARDEDGNAGEAASVPVVVSHSDRARANFASLTSNRTEIGVQEAVRIEAEVADPVPILTEVSLYANGILLAEMDLDSEAEQFGKFWSWQGTIPTPGSWDIYAVATDTDGNRGLSESVRVEVGVAVLRLEVSSDQVHVGDNVTLDLNISGGDEEFHRADFYVDGAFLASDHDEPFRATWTPSELGTYELSAEALSLVLGEFLEAPPVTVDVLAPPAPPTFAWVEEDSSTGQHLNDITFFNSQFVAVGANGALLTSGGGGAWTHRTSNIGTSLRSVTSGNGQFVAVGDEGGVVTSTNGIDWVRETPAPTSRRLSGVAYGNGRFVAVGNAGVIRTLDDGESSWQPRSSTTSANLNAVAFGTDGFVAVGANGTIVKSADGSSWVSSDSPTTAPLRDIDFGGGRYVAVGGRWDSDGARILTSSDATSWSMTGSGIPNVMHGVHHDTGINAWVTTGSDGRVAASIDGLFWSQQDTDTGETLLGATRGSHAFYLVGRNGTILRSNPSSFDAWVAEQYSVEEPDDAWMTSPEADPEGTGISNLVRYALGIGDSNSRERLPRLSGTAEGSEDYLTLEFTRDTDLPDVAYIVEASSNLSDWTPIEDLGGQYEIESNGDSETVTARDGVPLSETNGQRFLRLRLVLVE